MPPKLHDFMSRHQMNSTENSVDENMDQDPLMQENKPNIHEILFNKFKKSKGECIDELTVILEDLDKKENDLSRMIEKHNTKTIEKFNEDYDTLSQQIIKQVELHLRDRKEQYLSEIKHKRSEETDEAKSIRRNINKVRDQISSLREGLYRQNQYRKFISMIVMKDFEMDLSNVQQEIKNLRLPNVETRMDDRCYSSFKSDLDRLIIVNDEIKTTGKEPMYKSQSGISRSQNQPNQPNQQSQLEGSNRDMKRKSVANKFI